MARAARAGVRPEWFLATMLLAGCRPTVQPIAPTSGRVLAIAVGGGSVWWMQVEGDDGRILRAPIAGGDAESVCAVDASYGLAILGGQPYVVQPTVGHDLAVESCLRGSEALRNAVVLRDASGPVVDGDALVWIELTDSAYFRSAVALRRWSPGTAAPTTLWQGDAMTIPPPTPAVRDDGTILWQGSGGVMSMSPDGRVARLAATTSSVVLAAGGRAWWERPAEWDAPSVLQQQLLPPQQAQQPPPTPPVWQRVRSLLGLPATPQRADPGTLRIAGAPKAIDTGIAVALAGDARGTAWVDAGVPAHVHHGPAGVICNDCYDAVEPLPGTGSVRVTDGATTHTLAHGDFAPAIAVEGDWVYVADTKAGRIERISR